MSLVINSVREVDLLKIFRSFLFADTTLDMNL